MPMIEQRDVIKVGIAELKAVKAPNCIRTSGLGSCVGLIIFDKYSEVAGLAHIMLPDSTIVKGGDINRSKYADTAVSDLVKSIITIGGKQRSLRAKMAGGAQMFHFHSQNEMMRIGPRNVEAIKKQLKVLSIPLISEDVGGNNGRTIEFDPVTCDLVIRTVNEGVRKI